MTQSVRLSNSLVKHAQALGIVIMSFSGAGLIVWGKKADTE